MIQPIDAKKLCIGMYVILPLKWIEHNFMKNRFLITSEKQIKIIRNMRIGELIIDTSKGVSEKEMVRVLEKPDLPEPSRLVVPVKKINSFLEEVIDNKKISSRKKAVAVYNSSVNFMHCLIEAPAAEVIREVKEAIDRVVDVIVTNREVTANMLDIISHDYSTYTHSVNVGMLSICLANKLYGGKDHDMQKLGAGFFLHDLGKVRVDPDILNKKGKLDEDEMSSVREHPYEGYRILRDAHELNEEARIIALHHHERADGTGYPHGLRGNDIHDYGRICCIADVYDALTSSRPYKEAISPFKALTLMKNEMLAHFHKEIFEKFVLLFT